MAKIGTNLILWAVTTVCLAGLIVAITDSCLDCICKRNDCEKRIGKRITDGVCGPYYLSKQYYIDAGSPGAEMGLGTWEQCCQNMNCSRLCVRRYADKYGDICTYPQKAKCKDFTRLHWGYGGNLSRTACRTQDYRLREDNIATAWEFVSKYCEMASSPCD